MNETAVLDLDPLYELRELRWVLRQWTDDPNACDHCNHGDHATCDRWFRDVCQCQHPAQEEAPQCPRT